ncbi:cytochrome P450 2J4-like [Amphiura filiformis]|uniref:cytochrome P450 2J4-like n=1 Tax=Amphiura filiformis TaxID=82378 RepID=UPI003B217D89
MSAILERITPFLDLSTILVCSAVLATIVWYVRRPSNLPPGPFAWPWLGSIPGIAVQYFTAGSLAPHRFLTLLGKKYDQLYSLKLGPQLLVVVANDLETVQEAGHNQHTAARPAMLQPSHGGGEGVAISSGEVWIQQRRFTLSTLRGFGLGRKSYEGQIAEETEMLVKEFEKYEGKPFDNKFLVLSAVSNVLCDVMFGKRYEYSDADFRYIIDCLDRQTKLVGSAGAEIFIPGAIAKFLPKQNHPKTDMAKLTTDFNAFLSTIVKDHQKIYDGQNLHDYIDVYLKEMELSREVTAHLNELNLLTSLSQLFFAGTDTSATTLRWALMYLMEYPEKKKKVQEEIDSVVGRNRRPKLNDRDDLPYVDAIILETFRIRTPLPLSVPHSTTEDTVIKGYNVPKGTMIILNLWGAHHDPRRWDEPEKFNPDRFIDEKGCLTKVDQVIPFCYGRRQCIGEQLARKEVFIFFTHLLHHFRFERADNEQFDFEGVFGITHSPKPYMMRAIVRL